MILCAERFDRELPASPALGVTFPRCFCDSRRTSPADEPAPLPANLRVSLPPTLRTKHRSRPIARRAGTVAN